jgi:hypothetical protein
MAMPESRSWVLQEDQSSHWGVAGLRGGQSLTPGPGECTLCHHMVYLAVRSNVAPVTLPWEVLERPWCVGRVLHLSLGQAVLWVQVVEQVGPALSALEEGCSNGLSEVDGVWGNREEAANSTSIGRAELNPAAVHNCAAAGQPGRACPWLIHQPALHALEGWRTVWSWRCTALTSGTCTAPCVLLYCAVVCLQLLLLCKQTRHPEWRLGRRYAAALHSGSTPGSVLRWWGRGCRHVPTLHSCALLWVCAAPVAEAPGVSHPQGVRHKQCLLPHMAPAVRHTSSGTGSAGNGAGSGRYCTCCQDWR